MNKYQEVLDALDKLEECAYAMEDLPKSNWIDLAENAAELDLKIMDWVETVKFELFKGKQALQRLESIDNANPSEALECLMYLKAEFRNYPSAYEAIKQALLKAQEQEKKLKALEIIKKKRVPVPVIFEFDTYRDYLEWAYSYVARQYLLKEEEFVSLKEMFEQKIN